MTERAPRFLATYCSQCGHEFGPGDTSYSHCDLHLSAAAPDLLAALKAVLRIADRKTDEFDAARAAIAKAEGRP